MTAVITLLFMVLWGMALGVVCQLFSALLEFCRRPFAVAVCYMFGGGICFLATALFLFFGNGGEWGLYGFLFTILGFYLYHRLFWGWGKLFSVGSVRTASLVGQGICRAAGRLLVISAFPFGKIADKGALWRSKRKNKSENEEQM